MQNETEYGECYELIKQQITRDLKGEVYDGYVEVTVCYREQMAVIYVPTDIIDLYIDYSIELVKIIYNDGIIIDFVRKKAYGDNSCIIEKKLEERLEKYCGEVIGRIIMLECGNDDRLKISRREEIIRILERELINEECHGNSNYRHTATDIVNAILFTTPNYDKGFLSFAQYIDGIDLDSRNLEIDENKLFGILVERLLSKGIRQGQIAEKLEYSSASSVSEKKKKGQVKVVDLLRLCKMNKIPIADIFAKAAFPTRYKTVAAVLNDDKEVNELMRLLYINMDSNIDMSKLDVKKYVILCIRIVRNLYLECEDSIWEDDIPDIFLNAITVGKVEMVVFASSRLKELFGIFNLYISELLLLEGKDDEEFWHCDRGVEIFKILVSVGKGRRWKRGDIKLCAFELIDKIWHTMTNLY